MGPPFISAMKIAHLEGFQESRSLGDENSPWLLTTYKSWDDPPSRGWNTTQLYRDFIINHYKARVFFVAQLFQQLTRGVYQTVRDGELTPFRNHLTPFGGSRYMLMFGVQVTYTFCCIHIWIYMHTTAYCLIFYVYDAILCVFMYIPTTSYYHFVR